MPRSRIIPAGGTTGQVLTKTSNAAHDVEWGAGGGGGGITQLTGDVTAGPGSGSQVATVVNDSHDHTPGVTIPAYPTALPPNGAASGDLAGSYPSPTVDGLQGRAVSAAAPSTSDVLAWSGTAWAPTAPTAGITQLTGDVTAGPGSGSQAATVVALRGNAVSASVPSLNDSLVWDGLEWAPTAGGGGVSEYTVRNRAIYGYR